MTNPKHQIEKGECTFCGETFPTIEELWVHRKNWHDDKTPHYPHDNSADKELENLGRLEYDDDSRT